MQETLLLDSEDTKQSALHFLEQLEVPRALSMLTHLLNQSYEECEPLYNQKEKTFGENRNDPKVARLLLRATEYGTAVACSRLLRQHYSSFGQDVGQLTAYQVYSHLWQFNADAQFSTWVYRIAKNFAITSARRKGAVNETDIDVAAGFSSFQMIVDPIAQSPLDAMLETERRSARLRHYMQARALLSKEHRQIIELDDRDFSYTEMAEEVGIPVGTVRSRLNRAREQLEKLLVTQTSGDWFSEYLVAFREKQQEKKAREAHRRARGTKRNLA
jgi:RNA polymerase sigma-70 factor (ECF subfamily)